jgi:hypothetical protein
MTTAESMAMVTAMTRTTYQRIAMLVTTMATLVVG